jgi:hypothetical protein
MKRKDIPEEVKKRVYRAGQVSERTSKPTVAAAHRRMQSTIITEIAKLEWKRWNPDSAIPE